MADDAMGDQRDDLGGNPDGSDPRHDHRCGGDDRQHGRQGFHQLRPWPQRHYRHRARGGSRGVGMAAQTARRAHAELERATRLRRGLEERERLSIQVHDGAIQVLALVSRGGREIGGETAELAELAGEQERALRRLVSSADVAPRVGALTDVGAPLRRRASDRVWVSVPADPVLLDANARKSCQPRRQCARQRGRPCRTRRSSLRFVGGSRRFGDGEHSRRRCRHR